MFDFRRLGDAVWTHQALFPVPLENIIISPRGVSTGSSHWGIFSRDRGCAKLIQVPSQTPFLSTTLEIERTYVRFYRLGDAVYTPQALFPRGIEKYYKVTS